MLLHNAPDRFIMFVEFLCDHSICQECLCKHEMVLLCCLLNSFMFRNMALIIRVLNVLEQSQVKLLHCYFGQCLLYCQARGQMIVRVLTKEVAGLEVVLEILEVDSCLLAELSDSVGYILDMDDVQSFIVWRAALIAIFWLL